MPEALSSNLVLTVVKITLLLTGAFAISPVLKRPGHRDVLWAGVLLVLPLVAFLSVQMPVVRVLPTVDRDPQATMGARGWEDRRAPALNLFPEPVAHPARPTSPRDAGESAASVPATSRRGGTWAAWTGGIYGLGVVLLLIRLLLSVLRLRRLPKLPVVEGSLAEHWSALHRAGERPELYLSERCAVPFACGVFRPRAVLPAASSEWTDRRTLSTLIHEAEHLRRRDPLVRLFAAGVRALFWPHPLVWVAYRRLILAQEQCCDERVLSHGIEAEDYADDLLATRDFARHMPISHTAMAGWSQLGLRIRTLLDNSNLKRTTMKANIVITVAILAISTALSSIGFAADDRRNPPSGPEPEDDREPFELKPFRIKTDEIHKDVPGSDLSDWALLLDFELKGQVVVAFSSRAQLVNFSDLLLSRGNRSEAKAISRLIADRVEKHVDFTKRNLVMVRMSTGGPPFEEFRHEIQDGLLRFWLQRRPAPGGRTGAAARTYWHLYAIPKDLRVATTHETPSSAEENLNLWNAARLGKIDRVRQLLQAGAGPDARDGGKTTPLVVAAGKGHGAVVDALLEAGAQPDDQALIASAVSGHVGIVKALLERMAKWRGPVAPAPALDPGFGRRGGPVRLPSGAAVREAVRGAARYGRADVLEVLLGGVPGIDKSTVKAAIEAKDPAGFLPLQWACKGGHLPAAELLIEAGAKVKAAGFSGERAIHGAAGSGNLKLVKLLLDEGADANGVSSYELRPLHNAAEAGHADIVRLLLKHGADPAAEHKGRSVLDKASTEEVRKLIRKALAR